MKKNIFQEVLGETSLFPSESKWQSWARKQGISNKSFAMYYLGEEKENYSSDEIGYVLTEVMRDLLTCKMFEKKYFVTGQGETLLKNLEKIPSEDFTIKLLTNLRSEEKPNELLDVIFLLDKNKEKIASLSVLSNAKYYDNKINLNRRILFDANEDPITPMHKVSILIDNAISGEKY